MSQADPPKTVAVLGASPHRNKFGNKSTRAHQHAGWRVIPVNLSGEPVEGLETVRTLAEAREAAGGHLDRITVYLPPPVTRELLPEMAAVEPGEVWFNPGAADRQVLDEAREMGLPAVDGCSIVDLGLSPSMFP